MGPDTLHLISYLIKAFPSSINKKSKAGYSPLYLAFSLCRPPVASLLIKAGAHMDVTDQDGNNLLHTLLIKNQWPRYAGDLLGSMIELLDPELRKKLFTQRNSYTNGAVTPLHLWLKNTNVPYGSKDLADKEKVTLKMLLSYSNGEELEMVDGAGETPLHTLITSKKSNLIRILLDHNPMLLYRENAIGRTPAEVAYDDYIAPKLKFECMLVVQRYSWRQSIINETPEKFAEKDNGKAGKNSPWAICKEYIERFPGKRKLVSLNEANEVARRLAETHKMNERFRRTRYNGGKGNEEDDGDDDGPDVVSLWRKEELLLG